MRNQLAEQGFARIGGGLFGARSGPRSIVPRMNPLFHSIVHGVNPLLLTKRTTPGTSVLPPIHAERPHSLPGTPECQSSSLGLPEPLPVREAACLAPAMSMNRPRDLHGSPAHCNGLLPGDRTS